MNVYTGFPNISCLLFALLTKNSKKVEERKDNEKNDAMYALACFYYDE